MTKKSIEHKVRGHYSQITIYDSVLNQRNLYIILKDLYSLKKKSNDKLTSTSSCTAYIWSMPCEKFSPKFLFFQADILDVCKHYTTPPYYFEFPNKKKCWLIKLINITCYSS